MWFYETEIGNQGYKSIAGIDEVGRGPLAGPVVAASVILPEKCRIEGLNDSKKLSEKKRNLIFRIIQQKALAIGIGVVSWDIIDRTNISHAVKAAMVDSVSRLNSKPDFLLIDGIQKIPSIIPQLTIKKGDALSASIAAASIIAKVTRDGMMVRYNNIYPSYGFNRHKGYGTQDHLKNIIKFGPCKIHRKTFKRVKEYC